MKKSACILLACVSIFVSEVAVANGPLDNPTTVSPFGSVTYQDNDYNLSMLKRRRRGRGGSFGQGTSTVSVGYGAPNLLKWVLKVVSTEDPTVTVKGIGPAHLKYEFGVSDKIGIGVSLAYATAGFDRTESYDESVYDPNTDTYTTTPVSYTESLMFTNFAALARMNLHFGRSRTFDPYCGFGLGANIVSIKYTNTDPYAIKNKDSYSVPGFLALEAVFGTRFYFTDNIGAYVEVGYAKSLAQGGIVAKF